METSTCRTASAALPNGQCYATTSRSPREHLKRHILVILEANLVHTPPQPVPTEVVVRETGSSAKLIGELLSSLDNAGLIQTDIDGRCSIITAEGLQWVRALNNFAATPMPS